VGYLFFLMVTFLTFGLPTSPEVTLGCSLFRSTHRVMVRFSSLIFGTAGSWTELSTQLRVLVVRMDTAPILFLGGLG